MEPLQLNDENFNRGVSPQELRNAGLDMVYEREPQNATANYRLCDASVSQIDHVTSIASTVNNVYKDFIENGGLPPTYSKNKTHLFVSDCHSDGVPMLGQLAFSKLFKIDQTKLVGINIDKGTIYRTIDEIRTANEKLNNNELTHYDTNLGDNRKDRLVYLPLMEYIPNSEEEIELYLGGDYGDRGPESAVNYAILRYLQALKNEQEIKNVHVLAGNHEIETVCGDPSIIAPQAHKKYTYSSYSNITNDLFEKNFFEFCITKETEKGLLVFSHAPHTICNLPAITLLTKILLLNVRNAENVEDPDYVEDLEDEKLQDSIDDFKQSKKILIQELEKNPPLYEKIKSLVKSEKINWEEFYFSSDEQKTREHGGSSLKQASINLYNEIQSANFTAKDIFDWINILGHAARNLQFLCPACDTFINDKYSLLRNMLSATRSDLNNRQWSNLGWLVGERLHDDFIDLLWKDVFLSIFGHTPDTDMAFDLNGQFLNTDVRLGTREGGDKSKDYSSINFTFVNEDGELFLTNYKVGRDKNKKVTGEFKKLPAKIKIKNNNKVKIINAQNDVEITKSVEDKNEKDKPLSENNDNDNHDFHDDSDSDNNDNDNDSKPDAPKIKLQNPSPEIISISTDSNIENNNDNDNNHNHHKNNFLDEIKLNLDEYIYIDEIRIYLINIIEDKKKKSLQKAKEIHEKLNSLYEDCLVIQSFSEKSRNLYMQIFKESDFEKKLNILKLHKNEQFFKNQNEDFSKTISNNLFEKQDKQYLINMINNPKINFSAKLVAINSHLNILYCDYLSNIEVNIKEPYLNEFNKLLIEDKIKALNFYKSATLYNILYNIYYHFPKTETQKDLFNKTFYKMLKYKSVSEIKNYLNEQFIKIFTETFPNSSEKDINSFKEKNFENKSTILKSSYKFSSFINKSKMPEEEKTNAMEEFKNNSLEQKIRICNDIDEMEKQNKFMEQLNKANESNPKFLNSIPPLEPNDAPEI